MAARSANGGWSSCRAVSSAARKHRLRLGDVPGIRSQFEKHGSAQPVQAFGQVVPAARPRRDQAFVEHRQGFLPGAGEPKGVRQDAEHVGVQSGVGAELFDTFPHLVESVLHASLGRQRPTAPGQRPRHDLRQLVLAAERGGGVYERFGLRGLTTALAHYGGRHVHPGETEGMVNRSRQRDAAAAVLDRLVGYPNSHTRPAGNRQADPRIDGVIELGRIDPAVIRMVNRDAQRRWARARSS